VPEGLVSRQIGHIEAVPDRVELPAVIDAPEAAFFVAPKEQRGAAVGAPVIQYADPPRAVTKGD
jgi:hypothetical protein